MTRDKELLKQALTLLETPKKDYRHFYLCKKIRDRLAEPKEAVEPVAWMMVNNEHDLDRSLHFEPQNWHITWEEVPLYLHPPRPAVRLSKDELEAVLSDWMLNGGKSSREIYENVQTAVLRKNGLEVKDAN